MGKSQSRLEEARKEIADLEAKGDSPKLRERLNEFIRICRVDGELEQVAQCAAKLLALQEAARDDKLRIADTMFLLGNTIRLQLQAIPEAGKPAAFLEEKERVKAFARAEDLFVRTLDYRTEAALADPDNKELRFAIGKAKSGLAMIQSAYGGRNAAAQTLHEGALEIFAEFPLASDPEKWTFVKGAWSSTKVGVSGTTQVSPPQPTFSKPALVTDDSRSFRIDSRLSDQHRTQRATTTNTNNNVLVPEADDVSFTDDEAPTILPAPKRSTKWRLIIKLPRSSERRPSAIERLKRIGSFKPAQVDSLDGIVQKIDLEAGHRVEIGLPISDAKRLQLESQGIIYVSIGPKEKLKSVISERHCYFEEDPAADDNQKRWIIVDPHASGKNKGILVNGVRVNRAPLRSGDLVQLGSCAKVKMGSSTIPDNKKQSKDGAFGSGIEYMCERVITTIDDTDVSSVAPSALFEASDTTDTAFKHFHLLAVAAQMNLNGPALTMEQTSVLFATAVKNKIPFNLWDSWLYSELTKTRLVS